MSKLGVAGGAAFGALALTSAQAAGFAVEHQNAQAMGSAYAGAQARRADAGYAVYNPAALAGLQQLETVTNATVLWGKTGYENANSTLLGAFPAGGLASDDRVLPEAFITGSAIAGPITDRLTLGLTLSTPFGLKSEYAGASAVRYYAQNASLLTIAVAPTAAYEINDRLSVGASLKIEYMDLTASTVVDAGGIAFLNSVPGAAPGSSDLFAEFKGTDVAVGFTAGTQLELAEGVRLGFAYASKINHNYDGDVTFDVAGSPAAQVLNGATGLFADSGLVSTLSLPASYSVGLSADASSRFTLLASASLTRWSGFDRIVFDFDNPVQPPEIIVSNWSDAWTFAIGGEFQAADRTTVRAGFSYDETPVTDAYAGPRIPDTDRRWLNVGVTQTISDKFSIDVAGGIVVAPKTRQIRLSGTTPEDLLRGALDADVKIHTYSASLRLRYKF
jgi:long-chain fatty acid transport protein